jgi:hypothetical protein
MLLEVRDCLVLSGSEKRGHSENVGQPGIFVPYIIKGIHLEARQATGSNEEQAACATGKAVEDELCIAACCFWRLRERTFDGDLKAREEANGSEFKQRNACRVELLAQHGECGVFPSQEQGNNRADEFDARCRHLLLALICWLALAQKHPRQNMWQALSING